MPAPLTLRQGNHSRAASLDRGGGLERLHDHALDLRGDHIPQLEMKTSSGDEPSIDCRPSARASGNLYPGGGGAVAFEPAAANDERIVLDGDQPVNGIERDDGYLISPSQGRAPH